MQKSFFSLVFFLSPLCSSFHHTFFFLLLPFPLTLCHQSHFPRLPSSFPLISPFPQLALLAPWVASAKEGRPPGFLPWSHHFVDPFLECEPAVCMQSVCETEWRKKLVLQWKKKVTGLSSVCFLAETDQRSGLKLTLALLQTNICLIYSINILTCTQNHPLPHCLTNKPLNSEKKVAIFLAFIHLK